jgi:hypothetical protein
MEARLFALLLALVYGSSVSGQMLGDAPDKGASQHVATDCDRLASVAKQFLHDRGLKVAQLWGLPEEDWPCGPDYRCFSFMNAPPRTASGMPLNRDDVVRSYLKDPAKVDSRWKNLGHGYWAAPNRNFVMGAALQLKKESTGCYAKLFMSFALGGMKFLGILPYDPYSWPIPPDNGRLQVEYFTAIIKELPRSLPPQPENTSSPPSTIKLLKQQ